MSHRHPDDPTLIEELHLAVEDASLSAFCGRAADKTISPAAVIVGPLLLTEAADELTTLGSLSTANHLRAEGLQDELGEQVDRTVKALQRGDDWEEKALKRKKLFENVIEQDKGEVDRTAGLVAALELSRAQGSKLIEQRNAFQVEMLVAQKERDGARILRVEADEHKVEMKQDLDAYGEQNEALTGEKLVAEKRWRENKQRLANQRDLIEELRGEVAAGVTTLALERQHGNEVTLELAEVRRRMGSKRGTPRRARIAELEAINAKLCKQLDAVKAAFLEVTS